LRRRLIDDNEKREADQEEEKEEEEEEEEEEEVPQQPQVSAGSGRAEIWGTRQRLHFLSDRSDGSEASAIALH